MSDLFTRFDSVFFEKTRLSILTILSREDVVSYNELKATLGLSDGALYSHLEKLIAAGYIDRRKEIIDDAVSSRYRLTEQGRQSFVDYVQTLEVIVKQYAHPERIKP